MAVDEELVRELVEDGLSERSARNLAALLQTPAVTDTTYAAGTGPVLHDTSDGHTYRLTATAGALVLTQVS